MSPAPDASPRSTVAVVGLGQIGAAAASVLRLADRHDVVGCARRPLDRLIFERPEGAVDIPLRVLTGPQDAAPVDWVLLCTKAQDTPSAAPWFAKLCGPTTRIAVLQNGIDHAGRVAPYAKGAAVVPVLVYYNGERLAADRVRLTPVGDYDVIVPDDAGGRAFARLLEGSSLRVVARADFTTFAWRKLLLNVSANPITALTLQRQGVLRRDDIRALCLAVLDEAVNVGRADGAHFAPDESARAYATLMSFSPELGTSMYFDRLAGRKLEIEALTGAVVAAGERFGIPTPLNRALLALLRAVSDAAGSG